MRTNPSGFSLVEVTMALAIFATIGVALVGLLGVGLNVSREALTDAEVTMLVENVNARLALDPGWPGESDSAFYDESGAEVADEKLAAFRVTFKPVPGVFSSKYFDTMRVSIERLATRQDAGTWMLQRARLADGSPDAKNE
jgi:uncharacterized protein (TIGR02598 family)